MTSHDLDLLVLGLVQAGLATTYDLKSKAGLSVGSTAPVLARLEDSGLIEAPKPGVRDSRRFAITKNGKKHLAGWEELLNRRPSDIDEIIRIAYLAWSLGSPDVSSSFLENAARSMGDLATTRRAEANQLQRGIADPIGGQAYRWLRIEAEEARLRGQAEVLKRLAKELKNKKNKKR
jgi:DNA-binding PadR family transcriptional regulator